MRIRQPYELAIEKDRERIRPGGGCDLLFTRRRCHVADNHIDDRPKHEPPGGLDHKGDSEPRCRVADPLCVAKCGQIDEKGDESQHKIPRSA